MNGNGIKISERSSSQRSVYDYPEHLNPFYEDENHKRLRFWKIGSDKSNRRNSFSIDGLRGLWSFKTFKLKKRSSTLGINKTSESPPVIRRGDDRYGSQATIDGSSRHTIDIGLTSNFQRGAMGRSSLQDLNSVSRGDNLFIRNNRYRSTMQSSGPEYSQSSQRTINASITPVFRSRYSQPPISKGSSQISINSNPFDDDYETMSNSSERASMRRASRKKRPAPQPPTSIKKADVVVEEPSSETTKQNETVNITNLTAEIESFVRTADTDLEIIDRKQIEEENVITNVENFNIHEYNEKSQTIRRSPEENDCYPKNIQLMELTTEKIQNLGESDINCNERCKKSPIKILIRAPTDEETLINDEDIESGEDLKYEDTTTTAVAMQKDHEDQSHKNNHYHDSNADINKNGSQIDLVENVNLKHIENESDTTLAPILENNVQINDSEEDVNTPINTSNELILVEDIQTNYTVPIETELKITESNEDLPATKPNTYLAKDENTCKVQTIPLKWDSPEMRKKIIDVGKEPPTPPQRRRSVKEIIDSINKCQSLLKVNQNLKSNKTDKDLFQASISTKSYNNKNFMDCNINESKKKIYQNKHLFSEASEMNNNDGIDELCNIPLVVEQFNDFSNKKTTTHDDENNAIANVNVIFEKCTLQSDKKSSNVEWNPVPKPRRHRHSSQGSIN